MSLYKCPGPNCKHLKVTYTEAWVRGVNADGTPPDTCRTCKTKLVPIEEATKSEAPSINTYGCSPASKPFTH